MRHIMAKCLAVFFSLIISAANADMDATEIQIGDRSITLYAELDKYQIGSQAIIDWVKESAAIVADYYNVDKLADNCIDLWKDKEKYREFSENAIHHIKTNFLTSIEVESLVNLYQSLKQ